MDLNPGAIRFPIFVFLFFFLLTSACSTPSWFPIKSGPPHKAKTKDLIDKDVVLIDREEYVKVLNPRFPSEPNQPKVLYVPVKEYLSKQTSYTPVTTRKEEPKKEVYVPPSASSALAEKEVAKVSSPGVSLAPMKKKVLIAHFDDQTNTPEEAFGDWAAGRLTKELEQGSRRVLVVDYQMIKDFLEKRGISVKELEKPKVLDLLSQVFGLNALVTGVISGPYVFTAPPARGQEGQEGTASAIIKVEARLVDPFSGKLLKQLSMNNPIASVREKGPFPEEKAKFKAMELIIADLGRTLSRDLDSVDWSCRIVKVTGEEIYLNAGKLSGLKVGDVLEVFGPGESGKWEDRKGKIEVSAFLGIDASLGKPIDMKKPDVNDLVKLTRRQGT